jgi:hypothetical protein
LIRPPENGNEIKPRFHFLFSVYIAEQYIPVIIFIMSFKQYTPDQITELLMNPYVSTCSSKSISYTPDCKESIMELCEKE